MENSDKNDLIFRLRDKNDFPIVASPLAGWTDAPYRRILRQCGTRHMWIPFVAAYAVAERSPNGDEYVCEVREEKGNVQIFGNKPEIVAVAAGRLETAGAETIDFNCGCSIKKIHKGGGGSALLKDLGLLRENLSAIIESVKIPVSLKTRIGFEKNDDRSGVEACHIASDLGCAFVTLHGRTAKQKFDGKSDLSAINRLVEELPIPVIGNGDIQTPEDVLRMFETTGCAGVMVGRALMGDPWFISDCENYFRSGEARPRRSRDEITRVMIEHLNFMIEKSGSLIGVKEFRKHVAKYLSGFAQASIIRNAIVRCDDAIRVIEMLREFGEGRPPLDIIEMREKRGQ
ncbi:MAG: tRNA-dihydrouridine synthase [bacterium]